MGVTVQCIPKYHVPKLGSSKTKRKIPFGVVPIIRIIVFWALYWGSLIEGNYHISDYKIQ